MGHGRFFPDFVAELVGKKYLVVEFKGGHIEPGQQDKRRASELWAGQEPDELAFVWATQETWRGALDTAIARLSG